MDFKLEHIISELIKYFPLNEDLLIRLKTYTKVRTLKKKEFLFHKDEINKDVYFINKGLIKSYTLDSYGNQHILSFFKENNWIIDIHSHALNKPSIASFQAAEETELITVDYEEMQVYLAKFPELLRVYIMALQKKLAYLYEDRYRLISLSAENRYRNFMENNDELMQRLSQKDIAAYLGILPESLSRIRRQILEGK